MKRIILAVLLLAGTFIISAQPIPVRNVIPGDINTIQYPNSTGNTRSSQPHPGTVTMTDGTEVKGKITFFKKKEVLERVKINTGEDKKEIAAAQIKSITLEPKIYESKYPNNFKNPAKNFHPGYVVLPTGARLSGKVAQVRDFSDYDFFIYTILFLPEGSDTASSFQGGRLSEFGQEVNGTLTIWDGYVDGYLLRIVDGRYRLSRNPYSKTKNEFFTAIKNQATDSLGKQVAQAALLRSLKDGKNLNESIENAGNSGAVVAEVLGSVEINRKELLIFDTRDNNVTTVNKDTFSSSARALASACGAGISNDLIAWDKAEAFVKALNAECSK